MSNENQEILKAPVALGEFASVLDMDALHSIMLDKHNGDLPEGYEPKTVEIKDQLQFAELNVSVAGTLVDGTAIALIGAFNQDEGSIRIQSAVNDPESHALVKASILDHQARFEQLAAEQADEIVVE